MTYLIIYIDSFDCAGLNTIYYFMWI